MNKTSIILVLTLCSLLIFSSLAAANGIELEEGEIEFDLMLLSRLNQDFSDREETTTDYLTTKEGSHWFKVELSGTVFSNLIDWSILIEEEEGIDLSLLREYDNTELEARSNILLTEDTLWSALANDVELRGLRRVGLVEGQAVLDLSDTDVGIVKNDETYIQYQMNPSLKLTFKPYQANFTIGDEFETDPIYLAPFADDDRYPGLEASFILSEDLTLNNNLYTNNSSNETDYDYSDDPTTTSNKELVNKTSLIIANDNLDLTVSALLDLSSSSNGTDISGKTLELDDDYHFSDQVDDIATYHLVLSAINNLDLNETLNLNSESLFGVGSHTVDTGVDEIDSSSTIKLYNQLSADLGLLNLSISYTLDRTKYRKEVDGNDSYELTRTENIIGGEANRELAENLNWITELDFIFASETYEDSFNNSDPLDYNENELELKTTMQYSF